MAKLKMTRSKIDLRRCHVLYKLEIAKNFYGFVRTVTYSLLPLLSSHVFCRIYKYYIYKTKKDENFSNLIWDIGVYDIPCPIERRPAM